jgi:hypothetical protein
MDARIRLQHPGLFAVDDGRLGADQGSKNVVVLGRETVLMDDVRETAPIEELAPEVETRS